jgi:CubicO group peptidase (beta-lactamase class C family)
VSSAGWQQDRLDRLDEVLARHVEQGSARGVAWAVSRDGQVHEGGAGQLGDDGPAPASDSIFRISSMTKPVTAAAALSLVEDCTLRLDDPVDHLLPELADRQVLVAGAASLDAVVPAERPVTLRDLLTFRMGLGNDFTTTAPQVSLDALVERGLPVGPPNPAAVPAPDEWMRILGSVPLEFQPGERWLYHMSADVLGVLIARAAGQPLDEVFRERIFEPLGMLDTGFSVPAGALDRFGPCQTTDPLTGQRGVFDPIDGQWSEPPAFPGGGAGLVSTVSDFLRFAEMLLAGGTVGGTRILSPPSIAAMTTDHLTEAQRTTSSPDPSGAQGWGFGVGVQRVRTGPTTTPGRYGWDGGLGTSWANDPTERLIGVLLTTESWTSPTPPAICNDFWTATYASLA